jgi:glycosyltransferase involved in cell wall biosynthesis
MVWTPPPGNGALLVARIVSVTHSFKKTLEARGVDGDKIAVVTNGVDMSRFKPMPKDADLVRELGLEGKFENKGDATL